MINNILNSILNRASFTLSDQKDKVLAASKKRAQENFDFDIPSPEDFKTKLTSLASNSSEDLKKAEQIYNRTCSLIARPINALERSKEELESIDKKTQSINTQLDRFDNIIGILDPTILLLKGIVGTNQVPGIVDGILATQVTPAVSGTIIAKIIELKDSIKNAIQNLDNSISTFPTTRDYFNNQILGLSAPLNKGIEAIQATINQLKLLHNPYTLTTNTKYSPEEILGQIDVIWANFIKSLNLPELQDTTTGDQETNTPLAGTTLNEYLSNPNNLQNIVTNLIIPTRKIYYEITDDGPGTELREAGIIEEPIN